ncbi:MAG: cell division FtsA domain-containing protein [Sedimentibacter sp.]|uniref:cell division protein FtsA n=1 Tax=Sedimentibacter sp. TaxID=1960295 RepID=UPI002980CE29|nr:cell division FtsA domain-containing protein [Sedimentibacter sp.]MDW5300026.1 cell division FtsA domain-containing protein [Sedimentibacter sp.]
MNDLIFALDIGTRSVVGVVCENKNGILRVIEIKSVFHNQRAMVDGQIEDIAEVSRIVGIVKNSIEESLNIKLKKVCIAAAGRALKTERIILEKNSDIRIPISSDFKSAIETEALQLAQDMFSNASSNSDLFYCVGYSVLGYTMDGKNILNIEGHRANKVSVEIIAAFLPHTVIEGLYSCMDNNDLEVSNLTLEPIAAMDLIIPADLRLLNLALIDIGAGTSDIAISKDGSVVGYDMATIAGDEITECIMKNYLVDFNTAEKIKASLSDDSNYISITNILGITQNTEKKEILESVKTAVYDLCDDVASKITKLNKESPAAIFLAGGGSKTPFLIEFLSELLNISPLRIAMTEKESLHNIDLSSLENFGPELITPIGIAYSVILNKNYDFFSVTLNNKKIRLYGIRQMKVMDAILMSGFDTKKLIGFSGKSLRFLFNGIQHYYTGEFSTPSQIYVNSSVSNIETIIHPGDKIEVVPAIDGASPVVKISDITKNLSNGFIYFNGIKTELCTKYFVNNTEVNENYAIGNSDSIDIIQVKTIRDLYKLFKMDINLYNNFVKGNMVDLDFELYDGCIVDLFSIEKTIEIESAKETYQKSINKIDESSEIESSIKVTVNNKLITLPQREDNTPYIFADMLNYTNIDPANPKGNIVLLHNGKEASYSNLVSDNDVIIIKWDCD